MTRTDVPSLSLVVFLLDGQRFGVELARVERVLQMVALQPLPKAPGVVAGLFDYHGVPVPVMNVRRRFRLPERPARAADQLLLVRSAHLRFAFAVDAVEPVIEVDRAAVAAPDAIVPGLEFLRGIVRLPQQGLVFIHDLDAFLSLAEETALTAALAAPPA